MNCTLLLVCPTDSSGRYQERQQKSTACQSHYIKHTPEPRLNFIKLAIFWFWFFFLVFWRAGDIFFYDEYLVPGRAIFLTRFYIRFRILFIQLALLGKQRRVVASYRRAPTLDRHPAACALIECRRSAATSARQQLPRRDEAQ